MKHLLIFCQLRWHTVRMSEISWSRPTHTWYVTQTGILPSTVVFESVFLVTSVTWPTLVAWEHVTSKINFEGEAIRVFELFYLAWSPLPVTVTWIIPFFVGFPINLHLWLILGREKTQVLPVVYKESRHFVCSKNVSPKKKLLRFLRKPQSPEKTRSAIYPKNLRDLPGLLLPLVAKESELTSDNGRALIDSEVSLPETSNGWPPKVRGESAFFPVVTCLPEN